MTMPSIFVGGTGTGVGKTYVAIQIIQGLRQMGMDVGVMKPYSAGPPGDAGISEDAQKLAAAAGIAPTPDINPHHQTLEAPPYVGDPSTALPPHRIVEIYRRLAADRDMMVTESMGGLLVPIMRDYYMADLARDMGIRTLLVADNALGTIHNIVSTVLACSQRNLEISGIVLNLIHEGYEADMLQKILAGTTDVPVLATIKTDQDMDIRAIRD